MILSPEEVTRRLRAAASCSSLDAAGRLDAKVPMGPADIAARLREASDLLTLCQRLRAGKPANV